MSTSHAQVLLLRSASRNFPIDLVPELRAAGHDVAVINSLQEFISSPARHRPQLVLLEIGVLSELDRAVLVVDWTEHVQPFAPARFMLVMASKNLSIGERSAKLGSAEIVTLPLPTRNLLFKLELQSRLLAATAASNFGKPRRAEGFSAKLEEQPGPTKRRVLTVRGREPQDGGWNKNGITPSGTVRWRWVNAPSAERSADAGYSWNADCSSEPQFDEKSRAWLLSGDDARLTCNYRNETVYNVTALPENSAAPAAESKEEGSAPAAVATSGGTAKVDQPGSQRGESQTASPAGDSKRSVLGSNSEASSAGTSFGPGGGNPAAGDRSSLVPTGTSRIGEAGGREQPMGGASSASPPSAIESGGAKVAPVSAVERAKAALAQASAALKPTDKKNPPLRQSGEAAAWNVRPGDGGSSVPAGDSEQLPARSRNTVSTDEKSAAPRPTEGSQPAENRQGLAEKTPAEIEDREKESPSTSGIPAQVWVESVEATPAPAPRESRGSAALPSLGEAVPELSDSQPAPAPAPEKEGIPARNSARIEISVPEAAARIAEPLPPPSESRKTSRAIEQEAPAPKEKVAAAVALSEPSAKKNNAGAAENTMAERSAVSPDMEASAPKKKKEELHVGEAPAKKARHEEDAPPAVTPRPGKKELAPPEALRGEEDARRFLRNRHFVLITLSQLGDRDSSWQPVGRYRIYLSAQHRYYGLKSPADALPLWIYEGELAPEFIDKQKSWKFYDRPPVPVITPGSLPAEVLAYLHELAKTQMPADSKAVAGNSGPSVVILPESKNGLGLKKDPYAPEELGKRGSMIGRILAAVLKIFKK